MKKGITIFIITIVILLTGCRDKSGYKELDGMWQVRSVQYIGEDEKELLTDLYYSFQVNVMQVKKIGSGQRYGQYWYTGDSIRVWFPSTTANYMKLYEIGDTIDNFKVDYLKKGKMTLQSNYATLELRKY